MMKDYNIVVWTENDKFDVLAAIWAAGAVVTGVSGYYDGYYIQFDATPDQASEIEKRLEAGE